MINRTKKTGFLIIIILLCFPVFQEIFKPISSKPLNGYFEAVKRPLISVGNVFNGNFRDEMNIYSENSIPFRPDLVRLYNQIDFSAFGIPHAAKIVVGKGNYLFEESYIKAYLGNDYIGNQKIEARVRQFKELQDLLWDKKKIHLLVIFAPDKGSFYPEYIPERYLKSGQDTTNYKWYKQELEKAGINFIDFNYWFLKMKDTSRFLLYPKTGIHWSSYGAFLAMDSLVHYFKNRFEISMPEPVLDSLEISNVSRDWDADINQALNLIWNIPHPSLAYPHFHYKKPGNEQKPAALFIGDSFYFCWSEARFIKNSFRNEEFWYYDHDVYIDRIKQKVTVSNLNFEQTLDRQNVIVFLQTNAGYGNAGYWFVDRALALLNDQTKGGK